MLKTVTELNGELRLVNVLFGIASVSPLQNGCVVRTTSGETIKVRNGFDEFAKYDIDILYSKFIESLTKDTIVNVCNEFNIPKYTPEVSTEYGDSEEELLLEVEKEYTNYNDKIENVIKNDEPKKRGRPKTI